MSEVRRYRLPGGRELRTTERAGKHFLAIHDPGARALSLEIRPGELDVLRRAVADLAVPKTRRPRARTA